MSITHTHITLISVFKSLSARMLRYKTDLQITVTQWNLESLPTQATCPWGVGGSALIS